MSIRPKCASDPGRRLEDDRLRCRGADVLVVERHLGVGIAVVAQHVDARGRATRSASWRSSGCSGCSGSVSRKVASCLFRQRVEAAQLDRRDADRLTFGDLQGDVDLVLGLVQLDVERADARVRETAIAVERLDAAAGRRRRRGGRRSACGPRAATSPSWSAARWRGRPCRPARRLRSDRLVIGDVAVLPAAGRPDSSQKK